MPSIKTTLVRIGKSLWVRIPKALIDQISLRGEIVMVVGEDCLIIKPAHLLRQGWETTFQKSAKKSRPSPEYDSTISDFDGDWKWKLQDSRDSERNVRVGQGRPHL